MPKEIVLLKFHVGTDKLVLSRLGMDYRGVCNQRVAWEAPPMGDLWGLSNHEFVIRNDDGVISVIRRERVAADVPSE